MAAINYHHPVFDEIGRLALAIENEKLSPAVVAAFERFLTTMPERSASARSALTQAEHDAVLDQASDMLKDLLLRPSIVA